MQNNVFSEQVANLLSALNAEYPAPIIPSHEQMTTWIVGWMLEQVSISEDRFISFDAVADVVQSWLNVRKARLS